MPKLSIVIPSCGTTDQLERTLISVLENRPADCEIIVAHNGSYDDPYDLGDEVRYVQSLVEAAVLQLINDGVSEARGEIVHILRAGAEVEEGWTLPAVTHFEDPVVGSVAPLLLDAQSADRILAAGVTYRKGGARHVALRGRKLTLRRPPRARVAGPTLSAGFYRTRVLQALNGFEAAVGETLTDIDAALRLSSLGYRSIFEPACRIAARESHTHQSAIRIGRELERLFWRHVSSRGLIGSLGFHSLHVMADTLKQFPRPSVLARIGGRILGALETSFQRRERVEPQQIVPWSDMPGSAAPFAPATDRSSEDTSRDAAKRRAA